MNNNSSQRIYFLGIGGTLMGSLAQLAQQMGFIVSGSDKALYPPMSDQLDAAGITVFEGFDPAQLEPVPDLIVIGNAGEMLFDAHAPGTIVCGPPIIMSPAPRLRCSVLAGSA